MMLWEQLQLKPGLICLTGSGGKTTLAHLLASTLPARTIFCTSTKIYPSPTLPLYTGQYASELDALLVTHRAVCTGAPTSEGKLSAPPLPFPLLRTLADYVLVEADGSKGLPLKAHLPYEPVLPEGTDRTLLVVGASGFGKPVAQAAHRPARFAALSGLRPEDPATPQAVAAVLRKEGGFDTVLVNQVQSKAQLLQASVLEELLEVPVYAGEARKGLFLPLTPR